MSFGAIKYGLPAERRRGLVFAENFESPTLVAKNGGTVVGTVPIDFGASLSGTPFASCITFPCGSLLNSLSLSFLIEVWPGFNWDEDVTRYFFDTTNGSRLFCVKLNNAGNNVIYFEIQGLLSLSILAPNYSPFWQRYGRNHLIITTQNNSQVGYLNGNQVATNANPAGSLNPTIFYVGAQFNLDAPYMGGVKMLKIFNQVLTIQEAYDYYHNRVF